MTMQVDESQNTPSLEPVPDQGEPSREDLINAVTGEEPGAPAVAPAEEEEPRINRMLREREKANAEREAARNEAEEMRAAARKEAETEKARMIAEARAEAEAEKEAYRKRWRGSPIDAIRELGDPDKVADAIVKAGTPEGREMLRMQQELEEAKRVASEASGVKSEFAKFKEEQAAAAQQAQMASLRSLYLGSHASQEKAPYLHARWDPEEIFHRSNELAKSWQGKGIKDFTLDDVAQYLEVESKKRFSTLTGSAPPAQQVRAEAVSSPQGLAGKVQANGTRTVSPSAGSERRATLKPVSEMTPEEERKALIEAAAEERRKFEK